ncbi:VOC family protein [Photobacterium atrarenae]|uniref:VOC family protein n=1 Tax=Photobacterium atrarenae TaxID=865757 RepID=A0ABY5GPR7_9GAMM|nr:VOC family protein [Photobacterium atrarenae]UTV30654.1 VOC family protein [Photobacterium atrarenae]
MEVFGLQLNVSDIDLAASFYCNSLGFEVENKSFLPELLHIRKNSVRIILYKVSEVAPQPANDDPRFVLNMETANLQEEVERLKKLDVHFLTPDVQHCPASSYVTVLDPFDNAIDIVQLR